MKDRIFKEDILEYFKQRLRYDKFNVYFNGMKLEVDKDLRKKFITFINDGKEFLTLREFINKHSKGPYTDFIFNIPQNCAVTNSDIHIKVSDVQDFERCFNGRYLDEYIVSDFTYKSNDGDCCNYKCQYNLEIQEKIEE